MSLYEKTIKDVVLLNNVENLLPGLKQTINGLELPNNRIVGFYSYLPHCTSTYFRFSSECYIVCIHGIWTSNEFNILKNYIEKILFKEMQSKLDNFYKV